MSTERYTRIGRYTIIAPTHPGGTYTIYDHAGDMLGVEFATFVAAQGYVFRIS